LRIPSKAWILLGVSSKRVFDLGLLRHRVHATQPVRLRIGHRIETVQRIVEIGPRLAVCPAVLRFFGGQFGVVDRLLGIVAVTEMEFQQLCDFVDAPSIDLFERPPDGALISSAMLLPGLSNGAPHSPQNFIPAKLSAWH
jgi:hypothetical protein